MRTTVLILCIISLAIPSWGQIELSFEWKNNDYTFTQTIKFDQKIYNYYHKLVKNEDVTNYLKDHNGYLYLNELAEKIDENANALGYQSYELAEYLTAFVQAIPYKSDPDMSAFGGGNYCKHPIETLVEKGGDCEDKAILLATLFALFGFDAKLVKLPNHYAVALSCDGCDGYYYDNNGRKYYYIETTVVSEIGYMPDEYESTLVTLKKIPYIPNFERKTLLESNKIAYLSSLEENTHIDNDISNNTNLNITSIFSSNDMVTIFINGNSYEYKLPANSSVEIINHNIYINGAVWSPSKPISELSEEKSDIMENTVLTGTYLEGFNVMNNVEVILNGVSNGEIKNYGKLIINGMVNSDIHNYGIIEINGVLNKNIFNYNNGKVSYKGVFTGKVIDVE